MKLSPEQMQKIVAESVFSVQSADLKQYRSKNMPADLKPLSQLKEKQISNAVKGFASGCAREDIVVFSDGTFTENGKKGFLFSLDGFYSSELNMLRKKLPLPLPIRYEDLRSVSAKDSEIYFQFKDGRIANGFGSIYTGFIVEALSRILRKLGEENADVSVPVSKAEPESVSESESVSISENTQQMDRNETLFGCLWAESGKTVTSLFFVDLAQNRRYRMQKHNFSDEMLNDMKRLVCFARAQRSDSASYPQITERLPKRYLYLEMEPDACTDSQYVFYDCDNRQQKYVIHKDFFQSSKDSLKLIEAWAAGKTSEPVVLAASNYAGTNTAYLKAKADFSPVKFMYDQNKILFRESDVSLHVFGCLWRENEEQVSFLELSTGKRYRIDLLGLLSPQDLSNLKDHVVFAMIGKNADQKIIAIYMKWAPGERIVHLQCQQKKRSESVFCYQTGQASQTYRINKDAVSSSEYRKIEVGKYYTLVCSDRSSLCPLSVIKE